MIFIYYSHFARNISTSVKYRKALLHYVTTSSNTLSVSFLCPRSRLLLQLLVFKHISLCWISRIFSFHNLSNLRSVFIILLMNRTHRITNQSVIQSIFLSIPNFDFFISQKQHTAKVVKHYRSKSLMWGDEFKASIF